MTPAFRFSGIPLGRLFLTLLAWLLCTCCSSSAFAAGTPAGTIITSQASVAFRYTGRPTPATVLSNTVTVVVGQLAVVNVNPTSANRSAHINTYVDYPFAITNSGNGTDSFVITRRSTLDLSSAVYVDADGNGVLSSSEVAAGAITQTGDVPPDSSTTCVVRVVVPATEALIGQTDVLTVTVTSSFDSTRHSDAQCFTLVRGVLLTAAKSVDAALPLAGDRVTYTISCRNTGNGEATNCWISDMLDSRLRYFTNSATPIPDSIAGQRLMWNLGSVPADGQRTIVFQADIARQAAPGSEIHNTAEVHYDDGPNSRTVASTETGFITIRDSGLVTVELSPNHTGTGEPGDTIHYAFVLTNGGSLPESFALSFSTALNLVWRFTEDTDRDGRADDGEPAITTTGLLPGGGQCHFVAWTVLPVVPADLVQEIMVLRAQSVTRSENFSTATSVTTIAIPRMTLVKVAAAPDPRSGNEITYSLTYANEGHGQAGDFQVTDVIPASTLYVVESVRVNGAPKTDAADGDEVEVRGGQLMIRVGTVMPGEHGVIEFRVRIL